MAVTSLVTTLIGGALSLYGHMQQREASEDAAKARKAQFAAEQRIANVQNTRAIREQLRKQRVAAAAITNTGAVSGTSGSSGVAGGVSSVGSQAATNIGDFSSTRTAQVSAGIAQMEYGEAMGDSAQAQAIGSVGASIFNLGGGFDTIFNRKQPG